MTHTFWLIHLLKTLVPEGSEVSTSSTKILAPKDDTGESYVACMWNLVSYIYRIGRNFRQEKICANFATCSHWQKCNFFFYGNLYRTGETSVLCLLWQHILYWQNFYSIEYFYDTKAPGPGKILVQQKFPAILW